jgi:anthranilate phosphoribosyltransferase
LIKYLKLLQRRKAMIKEAISLLIEGKDLSEQEMIDSMRDIMEGNASDVLIASFLTALRIKGETVEEITGAARVMREKVTAIRAPEGTVDTCGTGGDMSHTFNISTTTALVVAACGVPVAKHGNRSVSSSCGSADVLEALGIKIDLEPAKVEACLESTGFGFMFAPLFHPAMKFAIGPRKEMGIRTVFNILGPLTNPAGAKRQVLGVFSDALTEPLAYVLGRLGAKHAFVVHGEDGLDELTTTEKSLISELKNGNVNTYSISPETLGMQRSARDELAGGSADDNVKITLDILSGHKGPKRDIVLMNSAAALVAGDSADDFKDGVRRAAEAIDSGAARKKLDEVKSVSNKL